MLKKEETYTRMGFAYEPECEGQENTKYTILFEMSGDNESIQIKIEQGSHVEESPKFPFDMLSEIVRDIEAWKRGPDASIRPRPRAPMVVDHRDEIGYEAVQPLQRPEEIQQQVDESMGRLASEEEALTSLSNVADPKLDIIEDDDPTGISLEDIAARGPVPETPDKFKKLADEIGRPPPRRN